MRVVLNKGAHSTVYIDDESSDIVIKEQNNPVNDPGYINRQKNGYEIIHEIKSQNADTGVILPELIKIVNTGDKQIIKEKRIQGKSFDIKTYLSLSEKQKNDIAKQMAVFLNAMHSSYKCEPAKESIKNMAKGKLNNANDIIDRFGGVLPKNIADRLKQAEEFLSSSDMSDEVVVMTHKDLRTSNIIYDKNTGKIAVIDFELAGPDNVYHDFIAFAPASSMPWDFTKRVISFYNQIPNKKYPIIIDSKKVQNMLFYGVMHEYARCIRPGDNEKATEKYFAMMYSKLENVTGIKFDKKSGFKKAMIKILTKLGIKELKNVNRDM